MNKKVSSVLLVDDDDDCNFFHKRLLTKMKCTDHVHISMDGRDALNYLTSNINAKSQQPNIIFLDINMPRMNGWEFLEEYKMFDDELKKNIILIILSTSLNPDDKTRADSCTDVAGFCNKFLDQASLKEIISNTLRTWRKKSRESQRLSALLFSLRIYKPD